MPSINEKYNPEPYPNEETLRQAWFHNPANLISTTHKIQDFVIKECSIPIALAARNAMLSIISSRDRDSFSIPLTSEAVIYDDGFYNEYPLHLADLYPKRLNMSQGAIRLARRIFQNYFPPYARYWIKHEFAPVEIWYARHSALEKMRLEQGKIGGSSRVDESHSGTWPDVTISLDRVVGKSYQSTVIHSFDLSMRSILDDAPTSPTPLKGSHFRLSRLWELIADELGERLDTPPVNSTNDKLYSYSPALRQYQLIPSQNVFEIWLDHERTTGTQRLVMKVWRDNRHLELTGDVSAPNVTTPRQSWDTQLKGKSVMVCTKSPIIVLDDSDSDIPNPGLNRSTLLHNIQHPITQFIEQNSGKGSWVIDKEMFSRYPSMNDVPHEDLIPLIAALGEAPSDEDINDVIASYQQEQLYASRKTLEQLTPQLRYAMRELFCLPDANPFEVAIWGLKRKPRVYQALRVTWMLQKSASIARGGFNATEMGLGKSTDIFVHYYIGIILARCWEEVRKDRSHHGEDGYIPKHLPSSRTHGQKCPSKDFHGLQCVCEGRLSSKLQPAYSADLVLVPLKIVPVWIQEFKEFIDPEDNPLDVSLVIAHSYAERKEFSDYRLSRNVIADLSSILANNSSKPLENFRGANTYKLVDFNRWLKPLAARTYFIVSTAESCEQHLFKHFEINFAHETTSLVPKPRESATAQLRNWFEGKTVTKVATYPGCSLKLTNIYRDEFHLHARDKSRTLTLLHTWLRRLSDKLIVPDHIPWSSTGRHRPAIWALSGTPYERGVEDLIPWLSIMERDGWQEDEVLKPCTKKEASALRLDWAAWTSQHRQNQWTIDQNLQTQLAGLCDRFSSLLQTLFIRHTADTQITPGTPITGLPTAISYYIKCTHYPEQQRKIVDQYHQDQANIDKVFQEWKDKGSNTNNKPKLVRGGLSFRFRSRIMASIPYGYDMIYRDESVKKLTQSEMKENDWKGGPRDSYYHYRDQITASSSKLTFIQELVKSLWNIQDDHGRPTRQVYCSEFASVIHSVYLRLLSMNIPAKEIAYISPILPDTHNRERLQLFCGQIDGVQPRYLLAVSSTIGVGWNLNVAQVLVLMEPSYSRNNELQLFKRLPRPGRLGNKTVIIIRLGAADNQTETSIVDLHSKRQPAKDVLRAGQPKRGITSEESSPSKRVRIELD